MSYLLGPRLHFAGRFKANVSTVNNDPKHFNNATFKPEYQKPQTPGHMNGWWNPGGSGAWQLIGCTVTGGAHKDGSIIRAAADDPVFGLAVSDGGSPLAKIVDLDSEQQMCSEIWGLQVRVGRAGAAPAVSGKFEVAAFTDIWSRATGGGGSDVAAGACWQSVLSNLNWGDLGGSLLLQQLKDAATAGLLSIKFNVDGYSMDSSQAQTFATGRIVGVIGVAAAGEPRQFVIGRQCMPAQSPLVKVNFFAAVVDESRGKLIADLGNALPTVASGGKIGVSQQLEMGLLLPNQKFSSLGPVAIGDTGWYEQTAGICEFPANRKLTADELTSLKDSPIALATGSANNPTLVAQEGVDGLYIRADTFVYRMSPGTSPGNKASVTLYATRFGKPAANTSVAVAFDSSGLQGDNGNLQVGKPISALTFVNSLTTDANGMARLDLTANTLGNPRQYIDGQVYGIGYGLPQSDPGAGGYSNPFNFVSVLVWSSYTIPAAPTWWGDIHPILQQYSNLYPFMQRFVDLGGYDAVVSDIDDLRTVLTLSEEIPHYMPVTRDLSPAKRQAILNWFDTTGNNGKPNLGTQPPAHAAAVVAAAAAPEETVGGGKDAAMRRRSRAVALTRA